jgi:hypothetical protein
VELAKAKKKKKTHKKTTSLVLRPQDCKWAPNKQRMVQTRLRPLLLLRESLPDVCCFLTATPKLRFPELKDESGEVYVYLFL